MPGGEMRAFWVLWVDEGFRTAVLGNPDGTFGWIVDRSTRGGADRIRAAREILDFNGYNVSQLRMIE
jgi:apolipoprotein D and lipocalin family protein